MFQRKQSLFLMAVILVNIIVLTSVPLWKIGGELDFYLKQENMFTILVAMICAASLAALVQFKVRVRQMAMNRLNLLLNLVLLAVVMLPTFNSSLTWIEAVKGNEIAMQNGGFLPIANIVLLFLANKGIRKDEELVKSVDRIR